MKRFAFYVVFVPVAIVVLLFAVANRQTVAVSFNPFASGTSGVTMPLFLLIFLVLMAGVLLGGISSWFSQGKQRKAARHAKAEAEHYRLEAERLRSAANVPADSLSLPPPA